VPKVHCFEPQALYKCIYALLISFLSNSPIEDTFPFTLLKSTMYKQERSGIDFPSDDALIWL
jgi:hypothetical protein